MNKKYTVGSLYAGVGGICMGFNKSGFRLKWANEYDKNACITYRENFKHNLIEGDIMDLDESKLSKVDILTAGFPCPPGSGSAAPAVRPPESSSGYGIAAERAAATRTGRNR